MFKTLTRTSVLLLCFLATSLLLSGCALFNLGKESPTVTVADLQLQEIKGLETIFLLELRVLNPGDTPLEISGLNCTLKIDDQDFAKGISSQQTTIPAYGTSTVPVMVYASMFELVSSVIQFLQGGESGSTLKTPMTYKLSGKIIFDKRWGSGTYPFQSSGQLSLD